ncbi:MAG: YbaB/EbfC family nucleoid-associated protein [Betaproteobacteria bacterium]|jgi:DNA-binding YbaB/EbfC family protein|nr:YbaB/EbfC family nucleoid-associated protein [Betaproteobacteria bacterium]
MMKGQIAGLMRQAQQMQEKMKQVQDSLSQEMVEGQSGAGLVKITMNCKHEVKAVQIDPSLMSADADDRETLQDLLAEAINDASAKAEAVSQQRLSAVTAGLPLPPGMKLF